MTWGCVRAAEPGTFFLEWVELELAEREMHSRLRRWKGSGCRVYAGKTGCKSSAIVAHIRHIVTDALAPLGGVGPHPACSFSSSQILSFSSHTAKSISSLAVIRAIKVGKAWKQSKKTTLSSSERPTQVPTSLHSVSLCSSPSTPHALLPSGFSQLTQAQYQPWRQCIYIMT